MKPLHLFAVLALAGTATAEELFAPPRAGTVAPAFGLRAINPDTLPPERKDAPVILDTYCGLRANPAAVVLVVFTDAANAADLGVAQAWHRQYGAGDVEVIAIGSDPDAGAMAAAVAKARVEFPVLDDRWLVVQARYGRVANPYSLVLNSECRVIGMFNRPLAELGKEIPPIFEAAASGQLGQRADGKAVTPR